MQDFLSLKMLRDAGLEPDWMTVYLGWRGFVLRSGKSEIYIRGSAELPFAEAQDFAYERIGWGDEEENYAALRLIDIETLTIFSTGEERFLRTLAAAAPVTPEMARRKWRLAHWKSYEPGLQKTLVASPPYDDYDDAIYERCRVVDDFSKLWREYVNHPPLPESLSRVFGDYGIGDDASVEIEVIVDEMARWAETERSALLTE